MNWCTRALMIFLTFAFSGLQAQEVISGRAFKSMSDFSWLYNDCTISPKLVTDGSVIFVTTDHVGDFFKKFHPIIKVRYILISHYSDTPNPGKYAQYLDDPKLIAWFGLNANFVHPKFHPIPIGACYYQKWFFESSQILDQVIAQKDTYKKKYLLYMNLNPRTCPRERKAVYKMFVQKSFCKTSPPVSFGYYLADMAQSKFVLSPRGQGLDCFRTWEALLVGSFPVVKTSLLDPLFADLPVVIVKDWNEVTEEFLNKKYEEMSQKTYNLDKLYAPYWKNLIRACAAEALKKPSP